MISFDQLRRRAAATGFAVRGAFHPEPEEFGGALAAHAAVVLLGFTGGVQWERFARAAEARDGVADPLDRWSRRMIGGLARELGATDVYPSGAPASPVSFQRLALRCEPVHSSPIGLLIHAQWGLWHAYRGALLLPDALELPPRAQSASPCATCGPRPCLSSCPVRAFRPGAYDLEACVDHVLSDAGRECRERGCLARRACPVGPEYRYQPDQTRFHMEAFLRSVR